MAIKLQELKNNIINYQEFKKANEDALQSKKKALALQYVEFKPIASYIKNMYPELKDIIEELDRGN